MFCTFRAIISPRCTHSCQSSGNQKVVATFDHLTLALHPPLFINGFGGTGRTHGLHLTGLAARFSTAPHAFGGRCSEGSCPHPPGK